MRIIEKPISTGAVLLSLRGLIFYLDKNYKRDRSDEQEDGHYAVLRGVDKITFALITAGL